MLNDKRIADQIIENSIYFKLKGKAKAHYQQQQTLMLKGERGEKGERGQEGQRGQDGKDGRDGKDGVTTVITKEVAVDLEPIKKKIKALEQQLKNVDNNAMGMIQGVALATEDLNRQIDERLDALQYDKLIDEDGLFIYIGEAEAGTPTSTAQWRIKRIDNTNNPDVDIRWANGSADFNKAWDNRASYTY